jgi:hypothetical protein
MTNDLQNSAPGPEFMLHLLAVCGIFKIQTQQLSCYFFAPFYIISVVISRNTNQMWNMTFCMHFKVFWWEEIHHAYFRFM